MSETAAGLRRKIGSAGELRSVVRTMKALAASSIGQYEAAVRALDEYHRAVELGLGACLRAERRDPSDRIRDPSIEEGPIDALVFGSDQGLVGQFNDVIADFAITAIAALSGPARVWAVGERVHARLADAGLRMSKLYPVPSSVQGITPLVGTILRESAGQWAGDEHSRVYVFHHRPRSGAAYEPVSQRLLPLDAKWAADVAGSRWPSRCIPEVLGGSSTTFRAFIEEYLFISVFRACAESLASENASRLAAMQRADRNIEDQLADLQQRFHRLRQDAIDEELFDVVSGFEALGGSTEAKLGNASVRMKKKDGQ